MFEHTTTTTTVGLQIGLVGDPLLIKLATALLLLVVQGLAVSYAASSLATR